MQGTLSGRCSTPLGTKSMKVNQKCCFLLFMLAIKTCSIANTSLSFEPGAAGHRLNTTFHSIANRLYCSTFLPNFPSWLTGLLSDPCSLLLPHVQTWICTVYTQDLKPKVLPQYIPIYIYSSTTAKPQNQDRHKQMLEVTHVPHSIHKTY